MGACDNVPATGVRVRVPLPPASEAEAHAVAVRPTLREYEGEPVPEYVAGRPERDTSGDRDAEMDVEGELLAEVEPQGDVDATGLPLPLGEEGGEGLIDKVSNLEADTEALADCAALPLSVPDRETEALRV